MVKCHTTFSAGFFHGCTKSRVGSHTTCDGKFFKAILFYRMHGMIHQNVHNCFLEGSRHVRLNNGNIFHLAAVQIIQNGRFQSAEAEIVGRVSHFCPREMRSRPDFPLWKPYRSSDRRDSPDRWHGPPCQRPLLPHHLWSGRRSHISRNPSR